MIAVSASSARRKVSSFQTKGFFFSAVVNVKRSAPENVTTGMPIIASQQKFFEIL